MKKNFTTRSLNVDFPKSDPYNALQMPVYGAVAFEFESAEQIAANFRGEFPAHVYSRTSNPTVEFFEHKLRSLTDARAAIAMASGMAAISTVILALCKSGDNIISGRNLFGHTLAFFGRTLNDLNIATRFSALNNAEEIESLIDANTRAIYFETVTNPQLEIADIEMLSSVAKKYNLVLIADSTLTPPNVFSSSRFGVDVEVMSTTKSISGGATSVGGAVIDNGLFNWSLNPNVKEYADKFGADAFIAKLRKNIYRNLGPCMTPQTALLHATGLDLLEIRFNRSYTNCMSLGDFLNANESVIRVDYPGLKASEGFALATKQFSGMPGTIMTFDLISEDACFKFMNKLKIIRRATNLSDNKSLIIHPWSTIYNEFTPERRFEMGIRPTTMRLSVGIEGAEDLIADILQAL
jgi:O-acetylhomoserine (thiol)-lyase